MTSDPSERIWAQAVDDGDWKGADKIATEAEARAVETAARRERLKRAYGAAIDPEHLLFPGYTLPRDMDCIDRRQSGTGEYN